MCGGSEMHTCRAKMICIVIINGIHIFDTTICSTYTALSLTIPRNKGRRLLL